MDGIKRKASEIFGKIKSIKHIEIIIAVVVVALVILIFSGVKTSASAKKSADTGSTVTTDTGTNSASISEWEKKLSAILSAMDGVGKAEVMITAKSTPEKITANTLSTATSSSSNGTSSSKNVTESPIIINNNGTSQPYVIKEVMPEVIGVIVVAEGADDSVTKLAIMRAVQTALKVDSSCVEIYPLKR